MSLEETMKRINNVITQARRLSVTPVVDDDFPEVKHAFDTAVLNYAALLRPKSAVPYDDRVIDRLRAELEAARRDAERYRFAIADIVRIKKIFRKTEASMGDCLSLPWGKYFETMGLRISAEIDTRLNAMKESGHD